MKKNVLYCALLAVTLLLGGCLEVEQHPKWVDGEYAGKRDNLPSQVNFQGDKLFWSAAISDRNQRQNEYRRTEQ